MHKKKIKYIRKETKKKKEKKNLHRECGWSGPNCFAGGDVRVITMVNNEKNIYYRLSTI